MLLPSLLRIPLRPEHLDLINNGEDGSIFNSHELACLSLLSMALKAPLSASNAEIKLGKCVAEILGWTDLERSRLCHRLVVELRGTAHQALEQASCELMTDEEREAYAWREPGGLWVMTNSRARIYSPTRKRFRRTSEEVLSESNRVVTHLLHAQDDHAHIEGVAGSGKTTMIRNVAHALLEQQQEVIVVAKNPNVFYGDAPTITSADLCFDFVNRMFFENRAQYRRSKKLTYLGVANNFSIKKLGGLDADIVASLALEVIDCFCDSLDVEIAAQHVTPRILGFQLSPFQLQELLMYASSIWNQIAARDEKTLPLQDNVIVKLASMAGFTISADNVILDENQDQLLSFGKILKDSSQRVSVISLGDRLQRLTSDIVVPECTLYPGKQLIVPQSIRCGDAIDPILRSFLQDVEFAGNDSFKSEVIQYKYAFGSPVYIPESQALLVTDSYFWILVLAIKLDSMNLGYSMSQETLRHALELAGEAIDMKKEGNVDRRRHPDLVGYASWEQFLEKRDKGLALGAREFDRWVSQGKNTENLRKILNRGLHQYKTMRSGYTLAMVDETKGHEWNRVCILPDLANIHSNETLSESMRHRRAYTALTRAIKEVYVPEGSDLATF